MGFDSSVHNKGIVLELGLNSSSSSSSSMVDNSIIKKQPSSSLSFDPSLTLALSADHDHGLISNRKPAACDDGGNLYRQDSVSGGGSSLISGVSVSVCVKREREVKSEESADQRQRVISHEVEEEEEEEEEEDQDDNSVVNGRKKLRLTKAQSALLEEAFKHHTTLNPKQKQELARELKLRPRQVEVWFQNRRARTKLKQTEVDCEYLKICCETLKEENTRLHKELQELKALKQQRSTQQQPLYMQLPAATLTMCPSCERIGDTTSAAKSSPFTMSPKPNFFNPFTNPSSAAC